MNRPTDTEAGWPTQIRLPGQTAAHPGPVDMAMMYLMHHAFRRDLAAFAAAAGATPVADRESWRALAARWELFSFALHHHHSGEDTALWPAILDRADEPGRAVLEAMQAEHAEIDPILEACGSGFTRLAGHADEDARAALAVRLVAARERLGEHLRHEETEAIPLIQRLLTNAEWERIDEEHFKKGVGLREVFALVPWVLHEVPGPVRRDLFARTGAAHRLMWRLSRTGFARREQVAFRHLG
jgi:hypothetical protein